MLRWTKAVVMAAVAISMMACIANSIWSPRGICPVCGHEMLTQWTELADKEVPAYLSDLHRQPELMRCPVDGHLETF